jgi:hypothetical protein
MKNIKELRFVVSRYVPHIHNLKNCIYIRWVDKEWFLMKENGRK